MGKSFKLRGLFNKGANFEDMAVEVVSAHIYSAKYVMGLMDRYYNLNQSFKQIAEDEGLTIDNVRRYMKRFILEYKWSTLFNHSVKGRMPIIEGLEKIGGGGGDGKEA